MIPVCVPRLADDDREYMFVQWLSDPGSHVDQGDWIAELLVDGILLSLEAPASGRLAKVAASPQSTVAAGQEIAWIDPE
jgi:pyruvate/2-oxoglutarate dehydrogenase complex dihydrolipoamide acyltransferase (E2) component